MNFFYPLTALAQIKYDISTPIPSSDSVVFSDINTYVSAIFSFGVYLAFGLALTIIVYGGVRYAASFSSEAQITNAKGWIFSAFAGLLVLITASLLLNTINPDILTADPLSRIKGVVAPEGPIQQPDGNFCLANGQCNDGYCDIPLGEVSGICKPRSILPGGNLPLGRACMNDLSCTSGLCGGKRSPYTCLAPASLPAKDSCDDDRQCQSNKCSSTFYGYECE